MHDNEKLKKFIFEFWTQMWARSKFRRMARISVNYDLNFGLFFTKTLFFCLYITISLMESDLIVPIPVGTERCKNAISTRLKHQINVKNNH